VLATPYFSQEEIEASDLSPDQIPRKGTLGNISLNLQAVTIAPQLQLDKAIKQDGEKHFRIKYWSTNGKDFPEAPSNVQKLTFSNDSKADMTFSLDCKGQFEILKTKTNTGGVHPLAPKVTQSKVMAPKPVTMFCLQPLKIVEVHVKFQVPKASDTTEWPMIMTNERLGEINASFANGGS